MRSSEYVWSLFDQSKESKGRSFLRGDTSVSLDNAQLELAAEYASIGVPYDMKKDHTMVNIL